MLVVAEWCSFPQPPWPPEGLVAYLDHASTTPLCPEALEAMLPALGAHFGNPSGAHAVARRATALLDEARERVAAVLGAEPGGVVFTSGGTEADNLALRGVASAHGGRIVCSALEHRAVLEPCRALGGTVVPATRHGIVDLDALADALGPDVALVSVQLANNEVGTIQPLGEVVRLVRERAPEALVHTDAVHAVAWLDVAVLAAGVDLVSISAHKFGGPKGAGALVVGSGVRLAPLLLGGSQERGRRAGTQHVAGALGLAAALEGTTHARPQVVPRIEAMRDRLVAGLLGALEGVEETVPHRAVPKVAGTAHLLVEGVDSQELLIALDSVGIAASVGSACASGALEPSHVLVAMGVADERAHGALRLSLGHRTTDEEVDAALERIPEVVTRLRCGRP
jgi:cysteine desulfurase